MQIGADIVAKRVARELMFGKKNKNCRVGRQYPKPKK